MKTPITLFLSILCFALGSSGYAETITTPRANVEIKLPTEYNDEKSYPLILLLHGYTSSSSKQDEYMKFGELVDEYGFVLMLPDGSREAAGEEHPFWNATDACCNFQKSEVDDSNYLAELISIAKESYSVDPARVYLIGHSNGGFMSYRMAHDHPQVIAAIASLAGASLSPLPEERAEYPVNILQIHGTEDATIKYEGGGIQGISYPSAEQSALLWAAFNTGSVEERTVGYRLDLDGSIDGFETTVQEYGTTAGIELWTIHGGSHVPSLSASFNRAVIEWLLAHPKQL